MAYTDASAVSGLLPVAVTASTNPNLTELGDIIDEISAELDGAAAAAGYAVPIAPPASGGPSAAYLQMAGWAKQGAAWHTLRRMFPNMGGPGGGDRNNLASEYREAYAVALKALRDGKLALVGAGSAAGGDARELPRSFHTSNTGSQAYVYASPAIDLDTVF